jgi:hypothetical protein
MTRWVILTLLYVSAALGWAAAVNADDANVDLALLAPVLAAIVIGAASGDAGRRGLWIWILLPWVIVPMGLPFGDTNKTTGGDDLLPVALFALVPALLAMLFMLIAAGARQLYERHRSGATRAAP